MHGFEFDKAKMTNQCGPYSWQAKLGKLHDLGNQGLLTQADRDCCDGHDTCYGGYDINGNSLIEEGKVNNERCEQEFHQCMMGKNNSGLGETVTNSNVGRVTGLLWIGLGERLG